MARAIKLDPQLSEAIQEAREALTPLVEPGTLGEHLGAVADADRLVTHRFACKLTGYRGWEWYVTLGRASRSKVVTVCESGLLPGPDALLAPDWVPWADRMSAAELAKVNGEAEAGQDDSQANEPEAAQDTPEGDAAPAEATQNDQAAPAEEAQDAVGQDHDEDSAEDADADTDEETHADEESDDEEPRAQRAPRRRRRRRR